MSHHSSDCIHSEIIVDNRLQFGNADASEETLPETKTEELDGGYGWVCVLAQLLITAHTWGVNNAFGVYLAYYFSHDIFPGITKTTYAFIGGLCLSQITLIAPLVTKSTATLGTHTTLAIGVVLETSALVAASFSTRVWHLFLTQGLLFGWGSSFLYVTSISIIPQWFTRRRGCANGIAAAGSGVGGLIYSLATESIIEKLGLPWAFRITALCVFMVNSVCAILMKDQNKSIKPNQSSFDFQLLGRVDFLLIIGWGLFSILGYTIVLFSVPEYAISIGLSAHDGAIVGALVNLGMAVGRPLVGYLCDKMNRINVITGATFLTGLFTLCMWTFAKSYATLLAYSFLVGNVCGTYWATIGPVLSEVMGIEVLPAAFSIIWMSIVLPGIFAEPIGIKLQTSGAARYLSLQIFTGFMFVAAAICLGMLRIHLSRKQR